MVSAAHSWAMLPVFPAFMPVIDMTASRLLQRAPMVLEGNRAGFGHFRARRLLMRRPQSCVEEPPQKPGEALRTAL